MTPMGYIFFYAAIIAAIAMPFSYIDAMERIKNNKDTLPNQIFLGICSGIIIWTILMMIRPA